MSRDYYEALGVSRSADAAEIKSAFRKLAMEHHPDRNGGCENAAGRFKELNEAYSVLSDPDRRAAYDRFGHAGVNGQGAGFGGQRGFQDVNDIFSEVFGDVFGEMFGQNMRRGNGPIRGADLQVRIPPGVDDGARIRLAGEGDAGMRGGPRGDLYLFISVKPHELFERDGLDLLCTVPVPMCTAALGGSIEAPCLTSEGCNGECRAEVQVPEGAQTGRTVRIRGKGMPSLNGRQRGDLVVELFVETPTNLTGRQKELLRELAGACGERQHPKHAGFFKKARKFWDDLTGEGDQACG